MLIWHIIKKKYVYLVSKLFLCYYSIFLVISIFVLTIFFLYVFLIKTNFVSKSISEIYKKIQKTVDIFNINVFQLTFYIELSTSTKNKKILIFQTINFFKKQKYIVVLLYISQHILNN